jgi:hypothetical protein
MRLLRSNTEKRATLTEVLSHSWIQSGYSAPPENHIPFREPLSLPLDTTVVEAMPGLEFGSSTEIHDRLIQIVRSEDYQKGILRLKEELLQEEQRIAKELQTAMSLDQKERKRGFIKKFFTADKNDGPSTPPSHSIPPLSRAKHKIDGPDIMDAFHPLVSVYYLVREKQERDRMARLLQSKENQP